MDLVYKIILCIALLMAWTVGLISVVLNMRREKRRTQQIAAMAAIIKFLFLEKDPAFKPYQLKQFYLFAHGTNRGIRNIAKGKVMDYDVTIFDYSYMLGKTLRQQSVILIESSQIELPAFSLCAASAFDKVGSIASYHDFYPVFSDQYLLRSQDRKRTLQLLDPKLLSCYTEYPNLCVEGFSRQAIYYFPMLQISPNRLQQHLSNSIRLHSLLVHQNK